MSPLCSGLIASALTVVWLSPSFANDPAPKNWTGQLVFGKKPHKEIKFGDNSSGKEIYFDFRGRYPQKVREDRGDRLRFFDGYKEGWADKDDFILIRDAVSYFTERIVANEKDEFAWHSRATAWIYRGEFDNSIKDSTECIRLNPGDATAFNRRGGAWHYKNDHDQAIKDFDEAIRLDPKYAHAFYNRGNAWYSKNDSDRAIEDYDEAIRLNPKYTDALCNRGLAWSNKKDYDRAIKNFDETIRLDPMDANAFIGRGNARNRKKDYDRATKDYDEAIRLDPKNANAFISRGMTWINKKDFDRAIKDYDEAIRLDPNDAGIHFHRAIAQMIRRKPESVDGFRKVVELEGLKGEVNAYPVFTGHLAARCVSNADAANSFLTESVGKLTDAWPNPLVQYLRNDLSETAVMKLATDSDKKAEAHYVFGQVAVLSGKTVDALAHFRWVKVNGNPDSSYYILAVAELEELERKK